MYKTITKLSAEQRSSLISDFLTKLGERIGVKRRKNSLSFPLHELFPIDESREILDSFAAAVSITVDSQRYYPRSSG